MPYITVGTTSQLQIQIPTRGSTGWDEILRTNTFVKIAEHDHSGSSGKGVQLSTGALAADSVTAAKILLGNDAYLRGRNAADSGDISIIKVDSSDELVFGKTIATAVFQDDGLTIVDNADNTKVLALQVSGISTGTTRTLTVPDFDGTVATLAGTESLSNKTLVAPAIGTPASGTLTNCTGLPVSSGISGLAAGVATFLATPSSANLITAVTNETGTGLLVFATSPTLTTPVLGTPTSGTLTNCTGLPVSSGISGLGTGVATFLATPSSANLITAVTNETGTGSLVFATSPTLVTPVLGTPSSGTLTSCTGLPVSSGISGLGTGVATFLTTPSSANLITAVTDETGTGALVFGTSPTIATPAITTQATFSNKAEIRFAESGGANYVGFSAPTAVTSNFVWSLPDGDGGASTFLQTDGSGALSFASASSGGKSVVTKTTTYTALTTDDVILVDTSGGDWTLTLYAASGNSGKSLDIIKTTSDTNTLTVDGNASETINGSTTSTVNTQYEKLSLLCDGTNWLILDRKCDTTWTNYTPTGAWTTNTTYNGYWRRVGDSMEITAEAVVSGAPTTATFTIKVPAGYVIDFAKAPDKWSNLYTNIGSASLQVAGTSYGAALVGVIDTSTLSVWAADDIAAATHAYGVVNATTPRAFANGDFVMVVASVPIVGWKSSNS